MRNYPTQERLKELFDYHGGSLVWRTNHCPRVRAGSAAGSDAGKGYRNVCVDSQTFRAHRLIYIWHHGEAPEQLDHIDGDANNNSIENLRPASPQQQARNRRSTGRTSRFKGVHWSSSEKQWVAKIFVGGKQHRLGNFRNEGDAASAYNAAAKKNFGEFARLNEVQQ